MRAARRLGMPALAAVVTTALGAMTMTMAQPAVAATTCVPTMLIGVHGTGEETGVIGSELSNLAPGHRAGARDHAAGLRK